MSACACQTRFTVRIEGEGYGLIRNRACATKIRAQRILSETPTTAGNVVLSLIGLDDITSEFKNPHLLGQVHNSLPLINRKTIYYLLMYKLKKQKRNKGYS